MLELKKFVPKFNRHPLTAPRRSWGSQETKQRRMMVVALTLLLVALGFVIFQDRDFWFPDTREAREPEDQPQPQPPAPAAPPATQAVVAKAMSTGHKKTHAKPRPKASLAAASKPADPSAASAPPITALPMTATTTRTVLPPLEVEVVAGDVHRTVHPGTNSVRVDLQPSSPPQGVSEAAAPAEKSDTAASLTTTAAERVHISPSTTEIVSQPVKPGYPLLARQMKVQGSVILLALIGRDGLIQDLRVVSGPPILASAAQEAVKQWHFKPHFQGADAVETQAKITVNFTISTN
jgi:periplasmic protein TonB